MHLRKELPQASVDQGLRLLARAAERGFDPQSYFAKLKINEQLARKNFPEAFGDVKDEQSVAKGLKKKARE